MMANKKIGLALGGGAARGLAHIGVLKALQNNNIKIDYIAGTSAGAVAGAAYAKGTSPEALKEMALSMGVRDWASLADVGIPHGGFISGNRIKSLLKVIIGDVDFKELSVPFACVACDLYTGEEVIINKGSVLEAVRASISIPIVFSVVERDGRFLVDGGLINQVPVNVVREMGADIVIGVNVIPTLKSRKKKAAAKKVKQPGIFDVMTHVIDITNAKTVIKSLKGANVVINPDTRDYTSADFHQAKDLILQGELAGELSIPEIELALKQ
ncbi:MAG: patatin-like phospholipase family protein [Dehalococcoidales bacterium]